MQCLLFCSMNLQQAHTTIVVQLNGIYNLREANNIANLLLTELTQLSKTQRLIANNQNLTQTQQQDLNKYLKELLEHKPIQQILRYTWFYKHKFIVDENVLIPRPETEELVDLIIKEFSGINCHILDIGTGSGCIAISLKSELKNTTVTAIDVSTNALSIAKENAKNIGITIDFFELDFLDETTWQHLKKFDVIVSNPPYITFEEKVDMKQNVLQYEPHLALFTPNNDALIFYRKIVAFAFEHLNPDGKIFVEINETLSKQTAEIFTNKGFNATIIKDLQGKDRMIMARYNS